MDSPSDKSNIFTKTDDQRTRGGGGKWKPLRRDILGGTQNWRSVGNTQQQDFRRGGDLSGVSFLPKLLQSIPPRACKPLFLHTQVRGGYPDVRQFYGWNQNIYRNERAPNICITWQNFRGNIWLENQVLATNVFCFVYLTLLYKPGDCLVSLGQINS